MAEPAPPPIPPPPGRRPMPPPDATLNPPADTNRKPADPEPKLGTYVVQVPKDQIYRVPPPENAYLVERYRNQTKIQRRSPCLACLKWPVAAVLLVLILLLIVIFVFFVAVRPATPAFAVKRLSVKIATKGSHHRPEYDFTMSVKNPSQKMAYSCKAGGKSAVAHNGVDIATGTTPALYQRPHNSTTFKLAIRGSNVLLPKEVEKSLKGSKDAILLELKAELTATARAGDMDLWAITMEVTCDVKVSGLAKQARIVSQECKTRLRL